MVSDGMYLSDSRVKLVKDFALEFGFVNQELILKEVARYFLSFYQDKI